MKNKTGKSKVWLILMIICIAVVVVSAGILIKNKIAKKSAYTIFEEMRSTVNDTANIDADDKDKDSDKNSTNQGNAAKDTSTNYTSTKNASDKAQPEMPGSEVLDERGIEIPKKNLDWDSLQKECKDVYAWIYVPDANNRTVVDYPILQHPTDDSYYLNYNIDGTKGFPGGIYTELDTKKDCSDIVTVIYGHFLGEGTMFTSLHTFYDKNYFLNQDHFIYVYTKDCTLVYEIFYAGEYHNGHLTYMTDYSNEYVYDDFIKRLVNRKEGRYGYVKEDIAPKTGERLVVLSTCASDYNANYRYLVIGKLIGTRRA